MNRRRHQILRLINEQKFVTVGDLSQSTGVSEVTIRKDLRSLDGEGLIMRIHGGASALTEGVEPFRKRETLDLDEKTLIARRTVDLIGEGESVLIDAGTTPLRVAEMVQNHKLSVVTHSLPVALALTESRATVNLVGGVLFPENLCIVGPETEAYLSRIRANKLILGASGIMPGRGPTTSSSLEAAVKERMIAAAKTVILVMDHSKFSEVGLSVFAHWTDIDVLVTSDAVPESELAPIRDQGVEILIVPFLQALEG